MPWLRTMIVWSDIAGTYPAEVLLVGEDLVLQRQESAAGLDEIEARQPVLARNCLRPQVLLDGDRVIGPALDRGVVGDDDAFGGGDAADARDHPGRVQIARIHFPGRELSDLEKGRARIEQPGNPFPREQLAACLVPFGIPLAAVRADPIRPGAELLHEGLHGVTVGGEAIACGIDLTDECQRHHRAGHTISCVSSRPRCRATVVKA